MRVLVLGAAAGGGLPQWNCNCECCRCARSGARGVTPQTQSSIAVTTDGENYVLFNASPDLGRQIASNPALHPQRGHRHSPISAVVLTNGDVDHVAGLLTLRERQSFSLFATARVHENLAKNAVFDVLNPECVEHREMPLEKSLTLDPGLCRGAKEPTGSGQLEIRLFAVPGKVALYLEDASAGEGFGTVAEDTVAVEISDPRSGERFFYIPGCAEVPLELRSRLRGGSLVLFDGTMWRNDEMIVQGMGQKTGARMGHLHMSGAGGSMEGLADLGLGRRIFIHINNTNPVWLEDSAERREVLEAGWEIAHDGMEIDL